jgi:hypothetical protein
MKFSKYSLFVIIIVMVFFTGCSKTIIVQELPNYLMRVDVTPGDEEKEVAVFLFCSNENVDINQYRPGDQNKFEILDLNNTFKSSKINNLNIDGVEEYIEKAQVVQYFRKDDTENPVVTKLKFNIADKEVKIKAIVQYQEIEPGRIKEAIKEDDAVSQVVMGIKHSNNSIDGLIFIVFWVLLIGIMFLVWYFTSKKNTDPPPKRLIYEEDEQEDNEISDDNIEEEKENS